MKILVVGAGAVGGYFGARLHEKGEDVTFLVRAKRKQQLEKDGLVIESANGDVVIKPNLITAEDEGKFDLVLLCTKAYQLEDAIAATKRFTYEKTVIVPLLNGISHIETLQHIFNKEQIIGGLCFIEATISETGSIKQPSRMHHVFFGELEGSMSDRIKRIEEVFSNTKAKFRATISIEEELWNKYLFITTMSSVTTLFKQPIGPILELNEGEATIKGLIQELTAIMRAEGAPLASDVEEEQFSRFLKMGYAMKSSMQRDMEKGAAVEADHLQGYLLQKAQQHKIECPILTTAYTNLKLYETSLNR